MGVEETIKGLDINPVSLQLAASQLTAGNQEIRYRSMGLHLMPYGPHPDDSNRISVGTLELLGQKAIIPRDNELGLADDKIGSQTVWNQHDDAELEDAVDAVKDTRVVIMNPPFTNRSKMGEKFPKDTQQKMRSRADALDRILVGADPSLMEFADKNSIEPLFMALADHIQKRPDGVVSMINPTIALSATSALQKRQILAERFHIHTILTGRLPREFALSQNTEIDESIVVMRRHPDRPKSPTRFVHLDRMPTDESEVDDLHRCLLEYTQGPIANGWGEVSEWPAERIEGGDWTPAIWRSPELAEAAATYANHPDLQSINTVPGLSVHATGRVLRGSFESAVHGTPGSFPILKSKGADAQTVIRSTPDEYWIPKKRDGNRRRSGDTSSETDKMLEKAGYLLITTGHRTSTARLTATADDEKYVGNGWMPVTGLVSDEAKALAVFINSTPGRLQLMRSPGRQIPFPTYSAAEAGNIKVPNIKDDAVTRRTLADCWEHTKEMEVPQFRGGECEVRRLWDEAVAEAMGWEPEELARLRHLLHSEPHVRGLGYNQYADEIEIEDMEPDAEFEAAEAAS